MKYSNRAVTYTVQIIEGSNNRDSNNRGPTVLQLLISCQTVFGLYSLLLLGILVTQFMIYYYVTIIIFHVFAMSTSVELHYAIAEPSALWELGINYCLKTPSIDLRAILLQDRCSGPIHSCLVPSWHRSWGSAVVTRVMNASIRVVPFTRPYSTVQGLVDS